MAKTIDNPQANRREFFGEMGTGLYSTRERWHIFWDATCTLRRSLEPKRVLRRRHRGCLIQGLAHRTSNHAPSR